MVVLVGYKITEYFKKFGKVKKFVIRELQILGIFLLYTTNDTLDQPGQRSMKMPAIRWLRGDLKKKMSSKNFFASSRSSIYL